MRFTRIAVPLVFAFTLQACADQSQTMVEPWDGTPQAALGAQRAVVQAAGDITAALDEFRALLGEPRNTTPGPHAAGRREIRWDGVPAAFTNNDDFPFDFFGATGAADPDGRKLGNLYFTNGRGFRVSDNDFVDIDASYDAEFNAFSPAKTFAAAGSNTMEVLFRVPGTNVPAIVNGFGAVFSDVDKNHAAILEFFDARGKRIAKVAAPRRTDDFGASFAGVVFDFPVVARVVITSGDAALQAGVLDRSASGKADLIVMDDFLYGEPQPISGQ
jgi:hypothetical protein